MLTGSLSLVWRKMRHFQSSGFSTTVVLLWVDLFYLFYFILLPHGFMAVQITILISTDSFLRKKYAHRPMAILQFNSKNATNITSFDWLTQKVMRISYFVPRMTEGAGVAMGLGATSMLSCSWAWKWRGPVTADASGTLELPALFLCAQGIFSC